MATRTRTQYPEAHERTAARRYLEHSHAAIALHGAPRREAERNAQAIDEEHPRARDIALVGTEQRELGKLPLHLRRHQLEERRRAGLTDEDIAEIRRELRRGPYKEEDEEEEERSKLRRAADAARAAGGTAAGATSGAVTSRLGPHAETLSSDILDFLVWGAALSIFYLLITKVGASTKLAQGATNTVKALISPHVDPLSPKGAM